MDIEQIPVIDNSEQISAPEPTPVTPSPVIKKGKSFKSGYVVAILLFVIVALMCGLTYFVLKDKGIYLLSWDVKETVTNEDTETICDSNTVETSVENSNVDVEENTANANSVEGSGTFKVGFAFPSENTPAARICFTNTSEISKQYCFWQKNSKETKKYSNDLENGQNTLPVGTYSVDYTIYGEDNNVYQIYSLRQCVYYADGGENNASNNVKYCSSIDNLFKDYLHSSDASVFMPYQLVNSSEYGGDLITFVIKEGQTTDLGTIQLSPYFDLNN